LLSGKLDAELRTRPQKSFFVIFSRAIPTTRRMTPQKTEEVGPYNRISQREKILIIFIEQQL